MSVQQTCLHFTMAKVACCPIHHLLFIRCVLLSHNNLENMFSLKDFNNYSPGYSNA